jgi:hypothetical protein
VTGCRAALIAVLLAGAVASSGCATCATNLFLSPGKRALNALKNRAAIPAASDIDPRVTLEGLLASGDDRTRWNVSVAAAIEGFVIRIVDAGAESANCFSPTRLDAHLELARVPDAAPHERVIVEVTPALRDWAHRQGHDWTTPTLQRDLTGRRVRVEGWLFFDEEHADESRNTAPTSRHLWRATAWELHPVTAIRRLDDAISATPPHVVPGNGPAPLSTIRDNSARRTRRPCQ